VGTVSILSLLALLAGCSGGGGSTTTTTTPTPAPTTTPNAIPTPGSNSQSLIFSSSDTNVDIVALNNALKTAKLEGIRSADSSILVRFIKTEGTGAERIDRTFGISFSPNENALLGTSGGTVVGGTGPTVYTELDFRPATQGSRQFTAYPNVQPGTAKIIAISNTQATVRFTNVAMKANIGSISTGNITVSGDITVGL
jgi:hypothetical protein